MMESIDVSKFALEIWRIKTTPVNHWLEMLQTCCIFDDVHKSSFLRAGAPQRRLEYWSIWVSVFESVSDGVFGNVRKDMRVQYMYPHPVYSQKTWGVIFTSHVLPKANFKITASETKTKTKSKLKQKRHHNFLILKGSLLFNHQN